MNLGTNLVFFKIRLFNRIGSGSMLSREQKHDFSLMTSKLFYTGPSTNDVTALGKQGLSDYNTNARYLKSVVMYGGGQKNCQKLRDVNYGQTNFTGPPVRYIVELLCTEVFI